MSQKIVAMMSSYKGHNLRQRDWLWHQTPQPFGVWANIQMLATAAEPDFLLLYNFNKFPQKTLQNNSFWNFWQREQIQQRQQRESEILARLHQVPKERIIYLVREPPFEKMKTKRVDDYRKAQTYCGYVSGPDNFAPTPDYMPAIWFHANSFRELNEMEPPEKNRLCTWITSGIDRTPNHRQRIAFLNLLREDSLDFDLYGRGLPDWAKGYGEIENKWNAMAPYYYNLAIENYAENEWYVSEKLWDALLAWCLPIYYGGSAADKLLPPESFLRLPSLDEKGLAYIQEVTANTDAWYEARDSIAEARQIILHKLNLLNWLSNFVDNLG